MRIRPFLKWPGGKYRLVDRIIATLPKGEVLIEPFVGGGSVFLNAEFKRCILNDANQDLIDLYQTLQQHGKPFIRHCRTLFKKTYNTEKQYYRLRKQFNQIEDVSERSALFLYLNRHGYNGLCRYNMRKGEFNVPFGRYQKPYFPESEMESFFEKSKRVTFVCEDFRKTMKRARKGHIVYCDPPYVPLSNTARFTNYRAGGFDLKEQEALSVLAKKLAKKGIPVLLSNHSNEITQQMYQGADIDEFLVQRFISCKGKKRQRVLELLAMFSAES